MGERAIFFKTFTNKTYLFPRKNEYGGDLTYHLKIPVSSALPLGPSLEAEETRYPRVFLFN